MKDEKGLTLLEIMVTIAILAILLGIGYASFRELRYRYDLNSATNTIYSDIRWCQSKSMGSPHSYGIKFYDHKYIVFQDTNDNGSYDANDTKVRERLLSNITLSDYSDLVYSRRGTASPTFTMKVINEKGQQKEIRVSLFKVRIR